MAPPSGPWWKHFFWLVPLGIVVGVALAFWMPGTEDQKQAKDSPPGGENLKPIQPPPTTKHIGQQQQFQPGQQLAANNGTTQWDVERRNQIPENRQYTTYRLPDGQGRTGQRPVAANPSETGAPAHDNRGIDGRSLARGGKLPKNDFDLQVALDRRGFSPGSIDGIAGAQTYAALAAFQQSKELPATGRLDAATRKRLELINPAIDGHTLTTNDFTGLQPLGVGWTAKNQQTELAHETVLERMAERYHCSPKYLKRANPRIDWARLAPGQSINIPKTHREWQWKIQGPAVELRISLSARTLQAIDGQGKIIAHFPCSIARKVDARPVGELRVTALAPNPNYKFDPARFPATPEARNGSGKLMLPPGPNNPVGTVWIDLSLDSYGIHGTPDPEKVGHTESLGCFRLSNWNAERLLPLVSKGMRVLVR